MESILDLSTLKWTLSGWQPNLWRLSKSMETGERQNAEIRPVPARVPGSVQMSLRDAGLLPDWTRGTDARACEWVENRQWIYRTAIPAGLPAGVYDLVCEGLDYSGWIVLDGTIAGEFHNAFIPITTPLRLTGKEQWLEIVFDMPPRFLGQFGWSSQIHDLKPRFYYTWDWMPRFVQTGITGKILLRPRSAPRLIFRELWSDVASGGGGTIHLRGEVVNGNNRTDRIKIVLTRESQPIWNGNFSTVELSAGMEIRDLPVELWYPHTLGQQPRYELRIVLVHDEAEICSRRYRVGFRSVRWSSCRNAPPEADPWICEWNGQPIFLQGINWTPIRADYADVPEEEYRKRIVKYRDIGVNLFRVWGGAAMEKECFYELCDEYGILVWQDFPLSSSGLENLPPDDPGTMEQILLTANHYLDTLSSHPSLLLWCGGNELQRSGEDTHGSVPCSGKEPLLKALADLVARRDPSRRFVPTTPSGPRFCAEETEFGKGVHWDVHGPWKIPGSDEEWRRYWDEDDALFRSEVGCPGASPADLIRRYAGAENPDPGSGENPLWRYPLDWWNELPVFLARDPGSPVTLETYVNWSRKRQAEALRYAAASCKSRFPACGGIIIWMGHDSFPLTANTSILDYDGEYKPAALALGKVFCGPDDFQPTLSTRSSAEKVPEA